jgi:bacterioferritin
MKTLSVLLEEQAPAQVNGFCILKPEFTDYEDDFYKLLKNNGWTIVNKTKKRLLPADAAQLYISKKDEPYYKNLCNYMSSGDCCCCTCSKECDDPISDMAALKERVRKQWGINDMKNAMHSSDSLENVERESKICFGECCEESYYNEDLDVSPEEWYAEHPDDDKHAQLYHLGEYALKTDNPRIPLIDKLQIAVAEEFLAYYQYTIIAPYMVGLENTEVRELFAKNAKDELEHHAHVLLERINQLGGMPNLIFHPDQLNQVADHKYIPVSDYTCISLLYNTRDAELGAIETYKNLEISTRDSDPVTHDMIIHILADEEEHLTEINDLIADIESSHMYDTVAAPEW